MVEKNTLDKQAKEFERPEGEFKSDITAALVAKAALVANALTIKMNNLQPWYETKRLKAVSATIETLHSRYVEQGMILVLTHVSTLASLHQTTTTEIAVKRGGETVVLNRDVPSAVDISVDWDGQVILIEGDRVEANFRGCTADDICTVSMSGYKIKA